MTVFFLWPANLQSTAIIFFAISMILGFASSPLFLWGALDLLGAIWTGLALWFPKTE